MKILWITNILFPSICQELGFSKPFLGGWMYSSAQEIVKNKEISLAVATVYPGKIFIDREIDGIRYFLLPLMGKNNTYYQKHLIKYWNIVNDLFHPDITHIHGTEYAHGLAYLKSSRTCKSVISIQGLLSGITRFYCAGLGFNDIIRNITLRDILKFDTIYHGKCNFKRRGLLECEMIKCADAVIGRTFWDKSHVKAIKPNVRYFFCNETLRAEFYKHIWRYEDCEKFSIFISQAGYPIKGLHQVLKALPYILRSFPQTKIYIGGVDIVNGSTFINRLKRTGYGKYIKEQLKNNNLTKHVIFLGPLDERQMCERLLLSNVFLCPSSIENSPNSLGEAQIMGVPCITSYVGGVADMMSGYERGYMYRFEEVEILAELICEVFKKRYTEDYNVTQVARKRHDQMQNAKKLAEIYKILNGG